MNNNFFSTARMLWDRGVDAHLYVPKNTPPHFMPDKDTYQSIPSQRVHYTDWDHPFGIFRNLTELRRELESFDFLIGCGGAPAYCSRAGIKLDLFVPYGGDLYDSIRYKLLHPRFILQTNYFAWHQRRGIRTATNLHLERSHNFEPLIEKLKCKGLVLNEGLPCLYPLSEDMELAKTKSALYKKVTKIREACEFLVFHHARHYWHTNEDARSIKRNDWLLRAFSRLIENHPEKAIRLVTFEYGPDVNMSKKLAESLGVSENVTWLPLSDRRDLLLALSLADVGTGEFWHSHFMYGTVLECMASGVPVIYNFNGYTEPAMFGARNAGSQDAILAGLDFFLAAKESDTLKKYKSEAQAWFRRTHVIEPIDRYLELFTEKSLSANAPEIM